MRLGDIELEALPAVLTAEQVAPLYETTKREVWRMTRAGTWPTPVLAWGRGYRYPTRPVLENLGLVGPPPEPSTPSAPALTLVADTSTA